MIQHKIPRNSKKPPLFYGHTGTDPAKPPARCTQSSNRKGVGVMMESSARAPGGDESAVPSCNGTA
uniref:Uncharacterized protein n=1 Tax=Arundo donax TaxID=35708 RepID=A0A0A9GTC8_ARUDO